MLVFTDFLFRENWVRDYVDHREGDEMVMMATMVMMTIMALTHLV